MSDMQTRAERIEAVLAVALTPARVVIEDDSGRHAGHAGARAGGETHYNVRVVSPAFSGLSRVERHRRVNALLTPEFAAGLHALSLILLTPDEETRRNSLP